MFMNNNRHSADQPPIRFRYLPLDAQLLTMVPSTLLDPKDTFAIGVVGREDQDRNLHLPEYVVTMTVDSKVRIWKKDVMGDTLEESCNGDSSATQLDNVNRLGYVFHQFLKADGPPPPQAAML